MGNSMGQQSVISSCFGSKPSKEDQTKKPQKLQPIIITFSEREKELLDTMEKNAERSNQRKMERFMDKALQVMADEEEAESKGQPTTERSIDLDELEQQVDSLTKHRKSPQINIDFAESKVVKTVTYRTQNHRSSVQKDKHATATTNGDSQNDMLIVGEPRKGIIKPSTTLSSYQEKQLQKTRTQNEKIRKPSTTMSQYEKQIEPKVYESATLAEQKQKREQKQEQRDMELAKQLYGVLRINVCLDNSIVVV